MIYKVVLDTNVIFSALAFDKQVEEVFRKVLNDKTKFLAYRSPNTTAELELKLKSPKFLAYRGFTASQVSQILNQYYLQTLLVEVGLVVTKSRDPKDNQFLALAEEVDADYLITGDKDLLVLKNYGSTQILKPSEFQNQFSTEFSD